MNDSRRMREIFDEASLLALEDRAPYLDRQCGDNHDLRQQVESLLAALEEPLGFLKRMDSNPGTAAVQAESGVALPPFQGTIDRYRLIRLLGEGGMGAVWEAEQTQPVRRRVALKLVKPGMDSANVLRRFDTERQTLSMMDHPGIAKVFDAGTAEDGRPWFVMELVQGQPITEWCDQNQVPTEQRLELFMQVCEAVQHAHQKGIIHRDLKPSNILVADYDGRKAIRIIDFGIAKAIGQSIDPQSPFTQSGQIIGTLEYMSPEQAAFNHGDIDTRSDIYSLGVLFFELLTGSTPFDRSRLRDAALDEMLRVIREEEPQRPSDRLSASATRSGIAASRDTQPLTLSRKLRGELDWIAMRALDKNREQRYASAAELAADVLRYLQNEPVLAGPPSRWYRFRKFVGKNRLAVWVATCGIVLLLAGVIGTSVGLFKARQALAREREAVKLKTKALHDVELSRDASELANEKTIRALGLLTGSFVERWLARQEEMSGSDRQFLDKILAYYEEVAGNNSDQGRARQIRVEGLHKVADLRYALGQWQDAHDNYERAFQLYRELAAEFPGQPEFEDGQARCLRALAKVARQSGKASESEEYFRRAIELFSRLSRTVEAAPESNIQLVESLTELASALHQHGKNAEAENIFQQAESSLQAIPETALDAAQRRSLHASMLQMRCYFYRELGRFDQALADGELAIRLHNEVIDLGADDSSTRLEIGSLHRVLGSLFEKRGDLAQAENQFREALISAQALVDQYPLVPEHRAAVGEAHRLLGANFFLQKQFGPAIEEFRQGKRIARRLVEDFPGQVSYLYDLAEMGNVIGLAFKDLGRLDESAAEFESAIDLKRQVLEQAGKNLLYRQSLAMSLHNLANVYTRQREFGKSQNCHSESVSIRQSLRESHPEIVGLALDLGGSYCDYGKMLLEADRLDEAADQLNRAVETLGQLLQDHPELASVREFLRNAFQNRGVAHQRLMKWPEALHDFEQASALDSGPNRVRLRQHRLVALSYVDPARGVDAVIELLELDDVTESDKFATARALSQVSGTHPDHAVRQESADRAVQLLEELHAAGIFANPDIAASLRQHDEFRHLDTHAGFSALQKALGKQARPAEIRE